MTSDDPAPHDVPEADPPGTDDPAVMAARRARLRWHCRRGMRELDEAMRAYLDHHYDDATEGERADFEALLAMQDPELYGIVCGRRQDERFDTIIDKITRTLGRGDRPVAPS